MVVLVGPPEEPNTGFRRNVVFSRELLPEGMTAEGYVEHQLALMRDNLEGFHLVRRDQVTLAGTVCPLFEVRSIGPSGLLFSALVAICVRGGVALNLSCSHFAGAAFDTAREELMKVVQSLTFVEPAR